MSRRKACARCGWLASSHEDALLRLHARLNSLPVPCSSYSAPAPRALRFLANLLGRITR